MDLEQKEEIFQIFGDTAKAGKPVLGSPLHVIQSEHWFSFMLCYTIHVSLLMKIVISKWKVKSLIFEL